MAEYHGLVEGLKAALVFGYMALDIVGDSILVRDQILGHAAAKKTRLITLQVAALQSLDHLDAFTFSHHPRVYNRVTDLLTNVCMDRQISGDSTTVTSAFSTGLRVDPEVWERNYRNESRSESAAFSDVRDTESSFDHRDRDDDDKPNDSVSETETMSVQNPAVSSETPQECEIRIRGHRDKALAQIDENCFAADTRPEFWILDSGATKHLTNIKSDFEWLLPMTTTVEVGGSHLLHVEGISDMKKEIRKDHSKKDIVLKSVYYICHRSSSSCSCSIKRQVSESETNKVKVHFNKSEHADLHVGRDQTHAVAELDESLRLYKITLERSGQPVRVRSLV